MNITRRGLVRSGVAALVGVSGCLGGGSNVRYPSTDRGSAAEDSEPLLGETSTPAANGNDAGSAERTVPNAEFARRTRRVVDELAWFGGGYDAAIAAYRDALATAENTAREIRARDEVTEDDLARLRDVADLATSVAAQELGGHFAIAGVVEDGASSHLDIVAKFAARGDHDRVDTELGRLANFFNGLRSRPYIDANLSDDPVQNRLLTRLRGEPVADEDPSLFAVYHGPTEFESFAYAGENRNFYRAPFDDERTAAIEGAFAGLGTPDLRRGVTVVRTYDVPKREEWPDPLDRNRYPDDTVHVQEYGDAATAGEALSSLLEGDVTQEGTVRLGDHEWRRVYYRHRGDVTYAFVLQAGEFLVSASASETAWEERTTWKEPLRRSWVV
jgi:hypothetical protein